MCWNAPRRCLAAGADALVLDSAHGHSENIMRTLREVKSAFPDAQVIAGNIATAEAAQALIDAGADAIKVGIGRARSAPRALFPASACRR